VGCLLQVLLLLKLRLLADVVLVGLPNVGKSSLIAALTHARAQVTLGGMQHCQRVCLHTAITVQEGAVLLVCAEPITVSQM
jgi:tRNA U34 5-carboxymethylaminomethyl modifying GTPase MnmE/TrmE